MNLIIVIYKVPIRNHQWPFTMSQNCTSPPPALREECPLGQVRWSVWGPGLALSERVNQQKWIKMGVPPSILWRYDWYHHVWFCMSLYVLCIGMIHRFYGVARNWVYRLTDKIHVMFMRTWLSKPGELLGTIFFGRPHTGLAGRFDWWTMCFSERLLFWSVRLI